ncbi:MAG: S-layer homology domain-containing protein [Firmicutes bacterium]|nr:S-layer homology domain-containing protein [Bacillota bacterium]
MTKKVTSYFLICTLVLFYGVWVNASATVEISAPCVSSVSDTVFVEGVSGTTKDYICIEVIKSGLSDQEMYDFIEMFESDADGSFSRTVKLTKGSGEYILKVRMYGSDVWTYKFLHGSSVDMAEILPILNSAETSAEIKSALFDVQKYSTALRQQDEKFTSLSDQTILYDMLLAQKPYNNGDYDRIHEVLNQAAVIGLVNEEKDREKVKKILEYNESIFTLKQTSQYPILSAPYAKPEAAEDVWGYMLGKNFRSIADVRKIFGDGIMLSVMQKLNDKTKIALLFDDAGYEVGLSAYEGLAANKKMEIANTVISGSHGTAEAALDKLNSLIVGAKDESRNNRSNTIGGGRLGSTEYTVSPEQPAVIAKEPKFADIGEALWAEEAVSYFSDRGIIMGYGDGTFRPNEQISREEFVKLIVMTLGLNCDSSESPFSDVSESDWFAPYVSAAYRSNIVNGVSDSMFGAGSVIMRQDAACIIFRALNAGEIHLVIHGNTFADAPEAADYAMDAIGTLGHYEIINGLGGNMFAPIDVLTRAQSAQLMYKMHLIILQGGVENGS